MSSMLCMKQEGGDVKIHDEETLLELLGRGSREDLESMLEYNASYTQRRPRKKHSTAPPRISDEPDDFLKGILQERLVKDKSVKLASAQAVQEIYQPVWDGQEETQDIHHYLAHQQMLKLRKKENLHKTWNERVYIPLRKKIIEAVDKGDWLEVKRRREELYNQYIELLNKRGTVHLDTMDPSEYYALALHDNRPAPVVRITQTTEVAVDRIRDPLLSQQRDRMEEDRTILRLATGYRFTDSDLELIRRPRYPLVPLGRQGIDSLTWVAMPRSQMETRPKRNMIGLQLHHYADFGQWDGEERNPEVIQQELNIQRKRKFPIHPPYRPRPPGFGRRFHTAPAKVDAGVNTSFDSTSANKAIPGVPARGEPYLCPDIDWSSNCAPPQEGRQGQTCPEQGVQESGVSQSNNTVFTSHCAPATEPLVAVE